MDNFILIDSKTRAPVPLPFHTTALDGVTPVTITNFHDDGFVSITRTTQSGVRQYRAPAALFGCKIITEAAFMAERS